MPLGLPTINQLSRDDGIILKLSNEQAIPIGQVGSSLLARATSFNKPATIFLVVNVNLLTVESTVLQTRGNVVYSPCK